jgi:hypothetical protein
MAKPIPDEPPVTKAVEDVKSMACIMAELLSRGLK